MSESGKPPLFVRTSRSRILLWLMGLMLVATLLHPFSELAGDVGTGEEFTVDRAVMEAIHHLASPRLTTAIRPITAGRSGLVAIGVPMGLGIHACWWLCTCIGLHSPASGMKEHRRCVSCW